MTMTAEDTKYYQHYLKHQIALQRGSNMNPEWWRLAQCLGPDHLPLGATEVAIFCLIVDAFLELQKNPDLRRNLIEAYLPEAMANVPIRLDRMDVDLNSGCAFGGDILKVAMIEQPETVTREQIDAEAVACAGPYLHQLDRARTAWEASVTRLLNKFYQLRKLRGQDRKKLLEDAICDGAVQAEIGEELPPTVATLPSIVPQQKPLSEKDLEVEPAPSMEAA